MSSFQPWIDDANINATQDYTTFVNDSQRQEGFKGGTPASAIRVNTALRQSSLVVAALMNALGISDNLNYRSTLTDVQNAINTTLSNKITSLAKITKSDNATNADNATNVSSTINGKAISDIFASNGTSVKNAVNAAHADAASMVSLINTTWKTYIEISQTNGGSITKTTKQVNFSVHGIQIGYNSYYCNLYYDCQQNKDGSSNFTNVTSIKISGNATDATIRCKITNPGIMYVKSNSNLTTTNILTCFYNYLGTSSTPEYQGNTSLDFRGTGNYRSCIVVIGAILEYSYS